jgi:hypothetical protein
VHVQASTIVVSSLHHICGTVALHPPNQGFYRLEALGTDAAGSAEPLTLNDCDLLDVPLHIQWHDTGFLPPFTEFTRRHGRRRALPARPCLVAQYARMVFEDQGLLSTIRIHSS